MDQRVLCCHCGYLVRPEHFDKCPGSKMDYKGATIYADQIQEYITLMSEMTLPSAYKGRGITRARKYIKFYNIMANGQYSAFQFIDPETGNVYKAKSWKQRGYLVGHVDNLLENMAGASYAFQTLQ